MSHHNLMFSAIALAMTCSGTVTARTSDTETSSGIIREAMTATAPDEFPEHGEPAVTVTSRNGRFVLGAGGMVKGTASFDWGAPADNAYAFLTSEIPAVREAGDGAKWQFSAQTSMLWLNLVALPGDKNQVGAYINFNFTGDGYCPALQYAYLRWRGLTVGYSYTLFTDQQASVPTIDYQGPNSFTGVQMALVNYEHSFGPRQRWRFGAGLNMPQTSLTDNQYCRQVSQRLPDVAAYIQYGNSEESAHLRLSGLLRNMYYRNLVEERNIDEIGWGVKLSGMTPIAGALSMMGQVLYGEGITSYYQDLTDCGLDMAYTGHRGCMDPVKSWGGYLGLQYDFTDRLHLSGAYSHIRLYPDGDRLPATDATYRYAQYAVGTLMYDITDWLGWGVEYIYGRRVQTDGTQSHDSRMQTALQFSF